MARKGCIPCLAPEIKQLIMDSFNDAVIQFQLQSIPDCDEGILVEFCAKKKRQPSAYQLFISTCLKEKKVKGKDDAPGKMRECATEWRAKKERGG